ncbi:MAG: adenylyl-sulfate kinase [Bacteroidota bacterium]
METSGDNLFPVFDQLLPREAKEQRLQQRGKVFWMTGLSGSGKTTIAKGLEKELFSRGHVVQVLDGDNVRTGINNNLGFSAEDRAENIRRIAEVSKLFVHCGIITINCFVSPTVAMRTTAREIIGPEDFLEVFVNTPLEVCEQRDPKGLYQKARAGEIANFTGIDAPFEPPPHPALDLQTAGQDIASSVDQLLAFVLPNIKYTNNI